MARFALIVGIEEYDDPHLKKLSKSVTDAVDFAKLLEKHGNCPHNHITLLKGQVSGEDLIKALKTFLNETAKNQEAIIYFSGHGVLEEKQDPLTDIVSRKGYLATSDSQLKKQRERFIVEGNGIPLESLTQLIKQTELSSLVFILDACHSGALIQEIDNSFNIFQNNTTYYFLAACQSYEDSWARKSKPHSEFTEALLDALSQDRADEEGIVTAGQAFDRASKTLENSRQKPTFLGKGSSYPLVTYTLTSLFTSNSSQPSEIIDNNLGILRPYLQQIKTDVLAWSVMEGISAFALNEWFAIDQSLGVASFLTVVREKFPQQPDGNPSLISVLQILTHHPKVAQRGRKKLSQWLEKVNHPTVSNFAFSSEHKTNVHLLVVIKQERSHKSFALTAQLKIGNKAPIPITIQPQEESPYQSHPDNPSIITCQVLEDENLQAKICPYLQDLLKGCALYLQGSPSTYNLGIEIFLPFEYLGESVDLWSIKKMRRRERKLGREYRVIVRSYERLSDLDYANRLQGVWNQMKTLEQELLLTRIKRLEKENNYCYSTLENDLIEPQSIGLSCLLPKTEQEREDLFFALHETGVPLALWLRSLDLEDDRKDHFAELLCVNCLQNQEQLIEKLFNKRRQAHGSSNPQKKWGYHAALLLDNPERIPNLNPLQFGR